MEAGSVLDQDMDRRTDTVHLRHRAPTAYFEPFLQRLPCLGADAVGPTLDVGPAVLEQSFDPAQTTPPRR